MAAAVEMTAGVDLAAVVVAPQVGAGPAGIFDCYNPPQSTKPIEMGHPESLGGMIEYSRVTLEER